MRTFSRTSCLAFAAALAASVVLADDKITTTDGRPPNDTVSGKIIEETADSVQIQMGSGGIITIPRTRIKHIEWDLTHQPATYHRAKLLFESSQWDPAATNYELALEGARLSPLLKPYAYRNLALCYTHLSESRFLPPDEAAEYSKKAVKAWEDLIQEHSNKSHPLVPEAVDRLVDMYMRLGQYDKVKALLAKLEALGGIYVGKALLLRAAVQEAEGNNEAAIETYGRVIERYEDKPDFVNGARAGLVRCSLALNDLNAAQKRAADLLAAKPPPNDIAAAMAHLVLGKLALGRIGARLDRGRLAFEDQAIAAKIRLGEPAAGPDGPRFYAPEMDEAILELLRPVVQYRADTTTEAEASYLAARCFHLLHVLLRDHGDSVAKSEGKKNRRRAEELYQALQDRRFTGLPWQADAKKQLAALLAQP